MKLRHRLVYATFLGAACCAASSGILLLNESASAPGDIAGGETMVNNELDEHSTEKFGTITGGYTLVEEPPDCYTKLGSAYCPGPGAGQAWTDLYMSSLARTSQVLTNAARMDPVKFKELYMGTRVYGCATAAVAPLRYGPTIQQSAQQGAFFLSQTDCTFQHNTCAKYCYLYGGNCGWMSRVGKYQPSYSWIQENIIQMTPTSLNDPLLAVAVWLASGPHCTNIYSTKVNHIGTGKVGMYYVQNMGSYADFTSNPIIDGSHWVDPTYTKGWMRYMASYSGPSPWSVNVVIMGIAYPMTLHLGTWTQGTYIFDAEVPAESAGCIRYTFSVTTNTGATFNLPETGAFRTAGYGGCTQNWGDNGPTPAPTPRPPTQAPTTIRTSAPSQKPTRMPSQGPSKQPTRAPTRSPSKAPSRAPSKLPTRMPSQGPSKQPTRAPTRSPSKAPSRAPSKRPTKAPTQSPSKAPTRAPSLRPTKGPTRSPSKAPTRQPTSRPSTPPAPSKRPTNVPTWW